MGHRYYTPIRRMRYGRKCLLIVKYPISPQNLALLLEWINADKRMSYSVLFLGVCPNLFCEEWIASFVRDVKSDFIWDENEVRLGLLVRYRLDMFTHVIIDNECLDVLCELIFSGFGITNGATYKFLKDEIAFGNWDSHAGRAFFCGQTQGSLKKLDDGWFHSLNDAMKRARMWSCEDENNSLFPNWLDAWVDSYVAYLQAEGNSPADFMSSLARAISQEKQGEAHWSEREDLIRLLTVFLA